RQRDGGEHRPGERRERPAARSLRRAVPRQPRLDATAELRRDAGWRALPDDQAAGAAIADADHRCAQLARNAARQGSGLSLERRSGYATSTTVFNPLQRYNSLMRVQSDGTTAVVCS